MLDCELSLLAVHSRKLISIAINIRESFRLRRINALFGTETRCTQLVTITASVSKTNLPNLSKLATFSEVYTILISSTISFLALVVLSIPIQNGLGLPLLLFHT